MVGFVTSLATLNPGNLGLGVALTILGPYFVGVIETASLALAPLFCRPEDLGLASGLLGSIRAGGASVAGKRFEHHFLRIFTHLAIP